MTINLGNKNNCICKKYNNTQPECINKYNICEQGKSVKLEVNNNEKMCVIIIDQCLITGNKTKCDAIFLFSSKNKAVSFLTELKGAGDIPKAFAQLSTTCKYAEYKNIINELENYSNKKVTEKFIIVSNGLLDKPTKEKLENQYKIRVTAILHSEATTPIPDLRDYI